MEFAFVAAVGGVGFEDVAVATLQFLQDGGLVDHTGSAVVGECAEKNLSKPKYYPNLTFYYIEYQ